MYYGEPGCARRHRDGLDWTSLSFCLQSGWTGSQVNVIAWLWARTGRSPDPAVKGAMVPLVSNFLLSTHRTGAECMDLTRFIDPPTARWMGYRFEVSDRGKLAKGRRGAASMKETIGRSDGGTCILTGAPMPFSYIRNEGQTTGLGVRLMAVVVDGNRSRVYLSPTDEQVTAAERAVSAWEPEGDLPHNPRDFKTPNYGLRTFASLFTQRQLVALTTFSDLVADARASALADASAAGLPQDPLPLSADGTGAAAYADAVATYLAFAVSKSSTRSCAMAIWETGMGRLAGALCSAACWPHAHVPSAETNPLAGAGGDIAGTAVSVAENLSNLGTGSVGKISNLVAQTNSFGASPFVISTDPPYYDNIGYADLSDFFYVWLRRSLSVAWPELFRRLTTPKDQELVATPYRHGGKEQAEDFFARGPEAPCKPIPRSAAVDHTPDHNLLCLQAVRGSFWGGVTGWLGFVPASRSRMRAWVVDGTWPIRTEATNALKAEMNALASSIVLVCRKRAANAPSASRADLLQLLRREKCQTRLTISAKPVSAPWICSNPSSVPAWVYSPALLVCWRTTTAR